MNASTSRLARRRSAASLDRKERASLNSSGARAAYSARRFNRADRQAARVALRALTS